MQDWMEKEKILTGCLNDDEHKEFYSYSIVVVCCRRLCTVARQYGKTSKIRNLF
ncbi:hypothetical protein D3C87_1600260 [compost metagenome]